MSEISPAPCSGRSNARRRSSRRGGPGSARCRTSANRSVACSSCPMLRSCQSTCAAARSCSSRPRSSERLRRRRTRSADARPWPGDRHDGDDAGQRVEHGEHGSRLSAALHRRRNAHHRPARRGDRRSSSEHSSDRRSCMSKCATWAARPRSRSSDHGVLDAIDQPFVAFTFGLAPDAEAYAAVEHHVGLILGALSAVGQRPAVPELRRIAR